MGRKDKKGGLAQQAGVLEASLDEAKTQAKEFQTELGKCRKQLSEANKKVMGLEVKVKKYEDNPLVDQVQRLVDEKTKILADNQPKKLRQRIQRLEKEKQELNTRARAAEDAADKNKYEEDNTKLRQSVANHEEVERELREQANDLRDKFNRSEADNATVHKKLAALQEK